MCLRTKSRVVADKSSRAIAARLDEYWMSLRIAGLNIPSMLPVNGQVTTETVITLQQALQNYHSLKVPERMICSSDLLNASSVM